jgi:deoxyribodipyrimidine photo-lyase
MNIFIFNRGLRLFDNTTLIHQIKQMGAITPIFIFTPEQIDTNKNKYYSNNSVQFMIESLQELYKDIEKQGGQLYFFYGDIINVLSSIGKDYKIASIGMNFDYTPYARQRSDFIQKFCLKNKIKFFEKEDYLLHPILTNQTKKKDGSPYLMFTPFKLFCMSTLKVDPVDKFNKFLFEKNRIKSSNKYLISNKELSKFYIVNPHINVNGGRMNGISILNSIKKFSTYEKGRDYFTYNTTFLSAHNHYMTISIREEYWAIVNLLGKKSGIISELYWREFYTNIVYSFPYVLQGQLLGGAQNKQGQNKNISFKQKFEKIKLPPMDKKWYDAWCDGTTGFPIVDAGMRQLNTTGYMHNRNRMITMSFLIKFMHIDWRYGEQYFATKLVDYDAMMNNSGVQWCAGCGTDAQPYFRYFNPWIQQKKYDPKCLYIKKYVKELQDVDPKIIHKWDKIQDKNIKYPAPILDHAKEIKIALKRYKTLS